MLGYSYGTKIVAQYAEYYPSHLRAGVLDGVVDTSEDLFTIWANQQTGAQIAFYQFMSN
ncbi:alpha/beta fold hydrolase [Moraxella ovis]|uniref:alpha/beta fold hydrolase n=1 Tax=Moraxella ovis TaxID=29433 RepID=UPI000D9BAAC1|nr:alpha/beta fold hydrolase [Moraxella ovis]SPX85444.1 alpha/beta hydrolase fold [Moraxella ovis]STZ06253.1 alpha/beta hydrolase fold [Moraxella ovis]